MSNHLWGKVKRDAMTRELTALATDVTNACLALGRIAARLDPAHAAVVMGVRDTLERMREDIHEVIPVRPVADGRTDSWFLDPRWLPVALEVSSRRPTVLLTVAANALRALERYYGLIAEQVWPSHIRDLIELHREWLPKMEEKLLDRRYAATDRDSGL